LNASYVLYLILFLGSLAFGLEAMLLGLGGRMSVLYRRNKRKTIALALAFGLIVVGLSAATTTPLGLEPLYICVLVLGYTFLVGAVIWNFRNKFMIARELPPPQIASDAEIKSMLEKRGFGAMVKKKKK
jgi:uncharacterized protein (DUF58 family)